MAQPQFDQAGLQANLQTLDEALRRLDSYQAAKRLQAESDATIAAVLARENPAVADELLWRFPADRRALVLAATPEEQRNQWTINHSYPEDSVGRLMDPPLAVLKLNQTVAEAIERLRPIVKQALVTYAWVVDELGKLAGVLVFRELVYADKAQTLEEIMVRDPFSLDPKQTTTEAMRAALKWHLPVYPVCDASKRLVGILRGQNLFEYQAFELSAQAGAMVGVEKEERLNTPWTRSLRFRHPWLQLNLLTAFVAAAVVGAFQDTLNKLVILAVFLPVLAGQSGNTGCQALAVSLRGLTLGEMQSDRIASMLKKEALLGFLNGILVGLTASAGMYFFARNQGNAASLRLAAVVFLAMVVSCTVSGVSGVIVPLTLRRMGADPATASSIFLSTATDVVSMGLLLGLATWLVL